MAAMQGRTIKQKSVTVCPTHVLGAILPFHLFFLLNLPVFAYPLWKMTKGSIWIAMFPHLQLSP